MALYCVEARSITYVSVLVEAESEHQAWMFAENLDGSEFDIDDGGWAFDDAYEVNELPENMKNRRIWNASQNRNEE